MYITKRLQLGTIDANDQSLYRALGAGMARWLVWIAAGIVVLITVFGASAIKEANGFEGAEQSFSLPIDDRD